MFIKCNPPDFLPQFSPPPAAWRSQSVEGNRGLWTSWCWDQRWEEGSSAARSWLQTAGWCPWLSHHLRSSEKNIYSNASHFAHTVFCKVTFAPDSCRFLLWICLNIAQPSTNWNPATDGSLTFSNDKASLHGRNSEGKLLQATRGAHVPVPLPTTTASATTMSWRPTGLDAPQQIWNNFCCMLRLVRGTHDLCYPVRCAAIVCREKRGLLQTIKTSSCWD